MNNDNLQRLAQNVCVEQTSSPPDFRFTNYPFAQQNLNEKPLPQDAPISSESRSVIFPPLKAKRNPQRDLP